MGVTNRICTVKSKIDLNLISIITISCKMLSVAWEKYENIEKYVFWEVSYIRNKMKDIYLSIVVTERSGLWCPHEPHGLQESWRKVSEKCFNVQNKANNVTP